MPCQRRWLGSKLKPKAGWFPTAERALVDGVADGLADEVGGDGPGFQAVFGEEVVAGFAVGGAGLGVGGLHDVEVVAPAGELEAVVTEGSGLGGEGVEGQVGPLAGEE